MSRSCNFISCEIHRGTIPLGIHQIHRIPGAVSVRADVVVFLRQGVNAGENAVGRLEAGAAVVPVYAKERVLGFLPGVKIVSISRRCTLPALLRTTLVEPRWSAMK